MEYWLGVATPPYSFFESYQKSKTKEIIRMGILNRNLRAHCLQDDLGDVHHLEIDLFLSRITGDGPDTLLTGCHHHFSSRILNLLNLPFSDGGRKLRIDHFKVSSATTADAQLPAVCHLHQLKARDCFKDIPRRVEDLAISS